MTKAEEILNKHLKIMDAETMIGKHGRTHKAVINAINEAIDYAHSSLQLNEKYKKVTFNEWIDLMEYKKIKGEWYNKHGYLRSYQSLIVKYESMMSDL